MFAKDAQAISLKFEGGEVYWVQNWKCIEENASAECENPHRVSMTKLFGTIKAGHQKERYLSPQFKSGQVGRGVVGWWEK